MHTAQSKTSGWSFLTSEANAKKSKENSTNGSNISEVSHWQNAGLPEGSNDFSVLCTKTSNSAPENIH